MTPREQFDKLSTELVKNGQLVLKTIINDGKKESSLTLMIKGQRWLVEEIISIQDGKISRQTHTISKRRGENLIWANLPPIQSSKEENV